MNMEGKHCYCSVESSWSCQIFFCYLFSCNQHGITDCAFENLKGILELNMGCCDQLGITDNAFLFIKTVKVLVMNSCRQKSITFKALENLDNIKYLDISYCNKGLLNDKLKKKFKNCNIQKMGF